jgi:23S rRNA (pseudouridine1915-N3)-methyltransferase
MNIELWSLGKEDKKELSDAIQMYVKRLTFYTKFSMVYIDNSKLSKLDNKQLVMLKEVELISAKLTDKDVLITLDENGKQCTSELFADKLNQYINTSPQRIIFLIGGSFGIHEELHKRAKFKMALSELTFPHQLVRLIFVEQLYRAFTILKGEKYHHI